MFTVLKLVRISCFVSFSQYMYLKFFVFHFIKILRYLISKRWSYGTHVTTLWCCDEQLKFISICIHNCLLLSLGTYVYFVPVTVESFLFVGSMFVGSQNFPSSWGCNFVGSEFYFVKIKLNKCLYIRSQGGKCGQGLPTKATDIGPPQTMKFPQYYSQKNSCLYSMQSKVLEINK